MNENPNFNPKIKAFIDGMGALCEMWMITYNSFVSCGMNESDAIKHTTGLMTAFMKAGIGDTAKE